MEPSYYPHDASGGADLDHRWREPIPRSWSSQTSGRHTGGDGYFLCSESGTNFGAPREVPAHRGSECTQAELPSRVSSPVRARDWGGGRTAEPGGDAHVSPSDEPVRGRQETGVPRELDAGSYLASATEGEVELEMGEAFSLSEVQTEPLVSREWEMEGASSDEETPADELSDDHLSIRDPHSIKREFFHSWEVPRSPETVQDPLSIEEETDELADDLSSICDLQSIKKEVVEEPFAVSELSGNIKEDPDFYSGVDATDSNEAATREHASDITRSPTPTSPGLFVSEYDGADWAVCDSSHPDSAHCEDDAWAPDVTTSTGGAATPTTSSGGTRDSRIDVTGNDTVRTTVGSAATGVDGEEPSAKTKPPFCYEELIAMAIVESPHRMATVSEINAYIMNRFPYFESSQKNWQKSVHCKLFISKYFIKVPLKDGNCKRSYRNCWMLDPQYEDTFENSTFCRIPLVKRPCSSALWPAADPEVPNGTAYYRHDARSHHQQQQQQHHDTSLSVQPRVVGATDSFPFEPSPLHTATAAGGGGVGGGAVPPSSYPQYSGFQDSTTSPTSTGLSVSEIGSTGRAALDSSQPGGSCRLDDTPSPNVTVSTGGAATLTSASGGTTDGGSDTADTDSGGTAAVGVASVAGEERHSGDPGSTAASCENPSLPYSELIIMAITQSPHRRATLSEIADYITSRFPDLDCNEEVLHESLCDSLYRNECFVKVPQEGGDRNSNYWMLDPGYEDMVETGKFRDCCSTKQPFYRGLAASVAAHRVNVQHRHHRLWQQHQTGPPGHSQASDAGSSTLWAAAATTAGGEGVRGDAVPLPARLNCAGWEGSTAAPTSPGTFVTEFDGTDRAAADSSHPGDDSYEDDIRLSEATTSTGDVVVLTSRSGGTGSSRIGSPNNDTGRSTAGSAASGASEEQPFTDTLSVGTADTKPPFCYEELIAMAIAESPDRRATLSEIKAYIMSRFPYFEPSKESWQKSIHCTLFFSKYFIKVPLKGGNRKGRGCNYWMLDPRYEDAFENGDFRHNQLVKWPSSGALEPAGAPEVPYGASTAYRPHGARDRQQRPDAGLSVQSHLPTAAGSSPSEPTPFRTASATAGPRTGGGSVGGCAVLPSTYPQYDDSTSTVTGTGLAISEVGSIDREADDLSHPGSLDCEDSALALETTTAMADGAVTRTSECVVIADGGSDDDTCADSGGNVTGSAAGGPADEIPSANTASATAAGTKPSFCYAELIAMAIAQSPHRRAKMSEIFAYIKSRFPYYERSEKRWKKAIQKKLSSNKCFVIVPQDGGKQKYNYWRLDPQYEELFEDGNYRKLVRHGYRRYRSSHSRRHRRHTGPTEHPRLPGTGHSDLRAAATDTSGGGGGRTVPHPAYSHCARSAQISDGSSSASFEESNLQNVVHDEVASFEESNLENDDHSEVASFEGSNLQNVDYDEVASFEENDLQNMDSDEMVMDEERSTHFIGYSVPTQGFISEESDGCADDPLSICDLQRVKIEVAEDPVEASEFSGCIKEEPDLDLEEDATDNQEAATRGHASDITCTGQAAPELHQPEDSCCEDDSSVSGGMTSTGDAITPTSASGGTADSIGSGTDTYSRGTTTGIAANCAGEERYLDVGGKASTTNSKPPFTYRALIAKAIAQSSHRRATLSEIFTYLTNRFPYFKHKKDAFRNALRCTLSANKCFAKVSLEGDDCNRRSYNYWMVDPKYKEMIKNDISGLWWYSKWPVRRTLRSAAPSEVPAGSGATHRRHGGHRQHCHTGLPVGPQLLDDVDEYSAVTPTSPSLSVSEFGSTDRAVTGSSLADDSPRDDDVLPSSTETSRGGAATLTSPSGGTGTNRVGGTAVGSAAGGASGEKPGDWGSAVTADTKPPFSYDELIVMAFAQSPHRRATLSGIIAYVTSRFPYYKSSDKGWQKSIRCRLFFSKNFIRVSQKGGSSKYGGYNYWMLDPQHEDTFENAGFHRRQSTERPLHGALQTVAAAEGPSGTGATRRQHDGHDLRQQHHAGLSARSQLPGDVDRHRTATRTSTGLSFSEVGSSVRAATDSSHTYGSRRSDDTPTSDTTVSTADAGTLTLMSASGGTGDVGSGVAGTDSGGAGEDVAPGGEGEKRRLGDTGSASTANIRPPFSFEALVAMAIGQSPNRRATASEIIAYIARRFPFFKLKKRLWQHSVRCRLSSSKSFVRVPREGGSSKEGYWTLGPQYKETVKRSNLRQHRHSKQPFCRGHGVVAASDVPSGTGAAHRQNDGHSPQQQQQQHTSLMVNKHSTTTSTSKSPSVSEVGSTGRSTPDLSEPGDGHRTDDTPLSDVTAVDGTATPTSTYGSTADDVDGGTGIESGATAAGSAADGASEEQHSDGAVTKPPFSYTQLSAMAISQSLHRRATISEISAYITSRFPYFERYQGWQKSLSNNLSRNKCFINVLQRGTKQNASYWMLDPHYKDAFKNGESDRQQSTKWPSHGAPRTVAAAEGPSGTGATHRQHDGHDFQEQHYTGLSTRPQLPDDVDRHSTATPSSTSLSAFEGGSTGRAACNSSHSSSGLCEDDIPASDTTLSTGDASTLTSASGGTDVVISGVTRTDGRGAGEDVAAGGGSVERRLGDTGSASTANTRPPLSNRALIAMALQHSPHRRATASEIIAYIARRFPFFKLKKKLWQRSVCCRLSSSKWFVRVPGKGGNSKGSYWTLDPQYKDEFKTGESDRQQSTKRPLHGAPRTVAAAEGPSGTGATHRQHDGHDFQEQHYTGLSTRPQLPGDVDRHSTSTPSSTSLSASEVGTTGRAACDSSHAGSGLCEDDTPASEVTRSTGDDVTLTSTSGGTDDVDSDVTYTDGGGAAVDVAAGGESDERRLGDTGSAGTANTKPSFSHRALIAMAIENSPHRRATASEIITYIARRFPSFKLKKKLWQHSIRCRLSSCKWFVRIPGKGGNSKGSYWTLGPQYKDAVKRGSLGQHCHSKQPFRRGHGVAAASEVPSGTSATHQRQLHASLLVQLQRIDDINKHRNSTVAPTSPSLFVSKFGSTDSSHPGDSFIGSTSNDTVGTAEGSAADGANRETPSGDTGSASTAETKPPFSYEDLIAMAIAESPHGRATVSEIIAYITSRFPYFKRCDKKWQKSIECKLTFDKNFLKVPLQGGNSTGKCFNYWMLGPEYEKMFEKGKFRRLRHSKRPFRSALGVPSGTGPTHRHHEGHDPRQQCHGSEAAQTQRPGDFNRHSAASPTSPSLSVSEFGSTDRAATDSSHPGDGRCTDASPSGDTGNSCVSSTGNDTVGTTSGRAADRESGTTGSADSAKMKPPFSYEELIAMAILDKLHRRATMSEIVTYVASRFPYFERSNVSWQKSIRCKLAFSKYFVKVPLQGGNLMSRCFNYWMIDPKYERLFKNGKFHRHKVVKRPLRRAHRHLRQHPADVPVRPQLPGDVDKHSTLTRTSTSLSLSGVGNTARAVPDSSHTGGSRCEDDTPASDVTVPTSNADTDGGRAGHSFAANGEGEERGLGDAVSASTSNTRPPYSFKSLITMAIAQSPHRRATLSEILAYIRSRFPYFKWKNKSWQHTVSCTLSSSKCFVKVPREGSNHKGKYFNYWKLDPQYMDTIKNGNFRRKRSVKQSFRKSLRVVPPRKASFGAAYHPHDAHDFHQWQHDNRASLPVRPQLPGDIDKHSSSTVTPTLTSVTVTEVDSTGQSAPNLTEPGVDLCEDDTLTSDVTVSVDDDATPTSASGGTADDVDSGTVTESGGTTASSAADGVRVACNADTRPPFNYTELSAMAIAQSPQRRATRSEISAYIVSRFPYFKHYKGWQKGLVNNLSRNKFFINVPQNAGKQKGTIWTLDPRYKGVIKNGNMRQQQTLKQVLQRTLQAVAPAKLPSGACSTRQQCDGPDHQQQHDASPPAQTQPLCDVDRHSSSTVTPTLTSVTVTEVDSAGQSAPNSTEPGVDLCENSSLASDVTVYVDDDATPTSASGGSADDVDIGTATESKGTTASSAANGVCEEQHPDDAGTSCNADTRPPFNYTELSAMAIAQSPHRKATRSEISAYILSRFPYFKHCKGWQKGLSNNLSRTKFFVNVPQNAGKQKGTIWTLDPQYKDVIENGNLGQQQFARQPLRKTPAKLPSGADATRQRRDGHDRQQQHDTSLSAPSQLLCDVKKHSSAGPTSPGLSVSEFDGTVRAAPDSSRPGESRREGDSLAADATASTGGAATSTSTSGGTGNCHIGDTDNEGGGTDAESAADEADGEQTSCNTGPAGTARAKRRFCYEELIAAAIIDSPHGKATVTEICSYIRRHFPYFRQCKNNWQKSLYGKLSIGKYFIKMPAEGANHNGRRFNYWMLDPQYEDVFKNGKFHRHEAVKRPFRRALRVVTTPEVSPGTGTACHPHGAHHRRQLPGDVDERSTPTRTSTSLSVSVVGSSARAASDSSHIGGSRCEDDTPAPDVTVTTNGAGSTTSASGGTDDVVSGIADSDGGGAGRSVAADGEGEERGLGDTDSTTTASSRPPYSFKALIAMAIAQSPHRRATRSEIYAYIGSRFPYFKWNKKSWQHTISCTLSSSKCFVKVPPEGGNHKGRHFNYWKLDPQYTDTFNNGNFLRKRSVKQSFCKPLRVVPPRKASFGAAYHPHDAHYYHQWHHNDRDGLPVRPQLPGDIDKRSSPEGDHGTDSSGNALLRETPNAQNGDLEQCTAEREVAVENDDGTVRPAPGCEEASTRQPVPEEDGRVDSGQPSVSCSVCHRVFTRKYRLKEHFSVHTGERPYSCDVCSRTFRLKTQLKRHSWLHGGECPYICNVCHKKFLTPGDLKRHSWLHGGECPYVCNVCHKKFLTAGDLKRHSWLHTSESPYMCGVCHKKFTTGSDLKRHSLLHSGVRPYSCGVCHKKFTSNGELKRHLLLHAGNCHYRCGFCRKPFLSGTSLRRHLRVHRAPVTGAVRDTTQVHVESQIRDESTD